MPTRAKQQTDDDDDYLNYPWHEAIKFVREIRASIAGSRKKASRLKPPGFGIRDRDYIGFVPTPPRVVRRMLELAEVQAGETVYDLGCGDGRILIRAVRNYRARGVGIDIDPQRLEHARRRARRFLHRITFRKQNVFDV